MLVIWSSCFVCDCSLGFSEYMQRRDQVDQHLFDLEPERTLHRIRREQRTEQIRIQANMENNEEQDLSIEQNDPREAEMGITEGIKHPGRLFSQMIHSCC